MKNKKYYVVIDQSTSASKLLLFNNEKVVKRYSKKHKQIYPKQGWVEHDPVEIIKNIKELIDKLFSETLLTPEQIATISITNQRETILAWDKISGEPLYNAIVWQCNRSADICESLITEGYGDLVKKKTGLKIDPYFSGTKIKWLVNNIPAIKERLNKKDLAIGTIDTWIIWNLSKENIFATEPSNASRTLLYDINNKSWDESLANIFGISCSNLPEIKHSSDNFGTLLGIPIKGVMADSQAALFGENCNEIGDLKVTLGTGASIMMQLGDNNSCRDERLLTTIAWENKENTSYALEGIIRSCADSLNWLEDELDLFRDVAEASNCVLKRYQSNSVYFIPSLQGLGTPFWLEESSAMFMGMKRNSTKEDLLYAVLESIVFQVKSVIDCIEEATLMDITNIFIDGGVSSNEQLMQLIADILNKKVNICEIKELSAIGALKMSGRTIDFLNGKYKTLVPRNNTIILQRYHIWEDIIKNHIKFY